MAQKPVLRAEVYAHAMRASQNRIGDVGIYYRSSPRRRLWSTGVLSTQPWLGMTYALLDDRRRPDKHELASIISDLYSRAHVNSTNL